MMDNKGQNIFELFQKLTWSDLLDINEQENLIKIKDTGESILIKKKNFWTLNIFIFDARSNEFNRVGKFTLHVNINLNISDFLDFWPAKDYVHYDFMGSRRGAHAILGGVFKGKNIIKISEEYKKDISSLKKTLKLRVDMFHEIKEDVIAANKRAIYAKTATSNYMQQKLQERFLKKVTKRTTYSKKGDFEFQIHKLNLPRKTTAANFNKYMSDLDIRMLGELFKEMLATEVFPDEYKRKLDNYFIKERLEDIIKLGRMILSLKSTKLDSQAAKKVINKVVKDSPTQEIKQLEGIWQKYFEKYLLYLFFSYKKILPKVMLSDIQTGEKRFPDFVGVNHYDGIDVIEIKTHLQNVLRWDPSHSNFAFSSDMSKAIIQTINYMDGIAHNKFEKEQNKEDLVISMNVKENLYHPRGIIIISSINNIHNRMKGELSKEQEYQMERDFTKLRNSIHNIQIFTFDEIINIADQYINNIGHDSSEWRGL